MIVRGVSQKKNPPGFRSLTCLVTVHANNISTVTTIPCFFHVHKCTAHM